MKKTILLAVMAMASLTAISAQEKAIKETSLWDNWFIQGQVGASYTFSESSKHSSFGDIITPHVGLSVGKYFSPVAGARLQFGGWMSKSYMGKKMDTYYKYKYMQISADGLFNLTNFFMGYKEDRGFNLIGIAGIAYVHGFKNTKKRYVASSNSVAPRVGIQADYRFTDKLSLNLEAIGTIMNDDFNGNKGGNNKYDATVNLLAGVTYRFGDNFKRVDVINPSDVDALNEQLNSQRALIDNQNLSINNKDSEITRLSTELANKPAPVVQKELQEETELNAVVVFRIGSANLEKNQDINIYNAARYLKEHPEVNVTLTGYADKSTGSKAVNQRISEQRAKAVEKVLVEKYNIAKNRITVKASGDTEQLFPTDEWNRVVVFTATSK